MELAELNGDINVIVLADKKTGGPKLYEIAHDMYYDQIFSTELSETFNTTLVPNAGSINMGDTPILNDFVDKMKSRYPADYYALIIWGNGDGYKSFSKGTESQYDNAITNAQLATILNGKGLSVVGFDTCLQGSLETLFAFKKSSDIPIMIASPWEILTSGWNYWHFLEYFDKSYRRSTDMVIAAVKSYERYYTDVSNSNDMTLVGYDLTKLDISSSDNGTLKHFIDSYLAVTSSEKSILVSDTQKIFSGASDKGRNFYDFLDRTAYPYKSKLKSVFDSVHIYGWSKRSGYGYKGLLVEHTKEAAGNDLLSDTSWDDFLDL